jgi:hypothetical protein
LNNVTDGNRTAKQYAERNQRHLCVQDTPQLEDEIARVMARFGQAAYDGVREFRKLDLFKFEYRIRFD